MCEHNDEGTFGLVLNKLTDLTLNDVMEEDFSFLGRLNLGGPVEQNTLHIPPSFEGNLLKVQIELIERTCFGVEALNRLRF